MLLADPEQVLVLELRRLKRGTIPAIDSLHSYRASEVDKLPQQAGTELVHLARYSPEFITIKHAWSKLKARLQAKAAHSRTHWRQNMNGLWTPSDPRL